MPAGKTSFMYPFAYMHSLPDNMNRRGKSSALLGRQHSGPDVTFALYGTNRLLYSMPYMTTSQCMKSLLLLLKCSPGVHMAWRLGGSLITTTVRRPPHEMSHLHGFHKMMASQDPI